MQIVFGLHLDGLKPEAPQTVVGAPTLGPRGLLEVMETQLGLPTPISHPSEASFSYLQCLREASSPSRFFHRSLEIDPVNVARTLLGWREQWYAAGWDATFPDDAPARLADMAAVEAIAKGRVPPTYGERLQRVAETLKERRTQIESVELHTPFGDLPYAWQRVVDLLPWLSAPGLELAPVGPAGSDLVLVQTRLLSMVDRDECRIADPEPLQGDRSVIVVRSASRDLSADAIAEFLLATGRISETLLVAEHDGIILDNALERAGLPRCGFQRYTQFRAATQVLKLSLALVWEPLDPYRLLQLLLHPTGPLPRWVRSQLADAVAESPGIGGPVWVNAIRGIGQTQRERYEVEEAEVEHVRTEIAYWLEGDRYDPVVGTPLEALLTRTSRVADWARTQIHTVESETEASLFSAVHAQAEALLTELARLREDGTEYIGRLELERRIDEVTTSAPDPSTYEEAGHARAATSPAAVTGPWPTVVWWDLATAPTSISYPWSRRELAVLRASGVALPEVEEIVRRQSREWLRPLCNAREQFVLVVHDDERGTHPLWTRIESLFDGIEVVQIESTLLGGETALEPLEVPTRALPLQALPAPRRWWSLPDDCTLVPREVESYSSVSKLCDYPHEWVLKYAARLRTGRAADVMDGSRLFGKLGHRLFEEFFRTYDGWLRVPDEVVLTWVRATLPGVVEREGAVLLGPGRGVEHQRVAATLETALVRLLAHLRSAGVVEVTAEASGEVPFAGHLLTGAIDLVLTGRNGQRAVLDVKWAGESYRHGLLSENRTLQLATYSYLQKNLDGSELWPPGAFFILSTGNVLASDNSSFPDAIEVPSKDGEDVANLWHRLQHMYDWRWAQLESGQIEVVTHLTVPDERSTPPAAGLRPVAGGDQYDDYVRLTGWESSR